MDREELKEAVNRIERMELYFDTVKEAVEKTPEKIGRDELITDMVKILVFYYENGLWLSDFERDERGELPDGLKRGVLSEDGLYNLLSEINSVI